MLHFNAPKNEHGFTLFELIITMVIAGILAAMSAPSVFQMYQNAKVNTLYNEVRGALQQSQREAMRRSTSCTVTLDASNNNTVTGSCLSESFSEPQIEIKANNNANPINYSYRGTVTNSRTIVIYDQNNSASSSAKCIVISSPLGILRSGDYTGDVTGTPIASSCITS